MTDVEALATGVRAGDRRLLAKAITLVESTHPDHQDAAQRLLERLLPDTGAAVRVGITGVPGVGKSTLIDALGTLLTGKGHRVAVLAIDPSSSRTGGSILGDKTRMPRLAADPAAYIRPSPTSGALGGVARTTRETLLLCEAAGFDVVLVETVGVGQSEVLVAGMVDSFLALMLPGAGDELQGIKRGLIELAHMIAINKADGDNLLRARQAARHYRNALAIIEPVTPGWRPPVLTLSAIEETGIDRLWETIEAHRRTAEASGELARRRREQAVQWFRSLLDERLRRHFREDRAMAARLAEAERAVGAGELAPGAAVDRLLGPGRGSGAAPASLSGAT
jgi:LAO/AO transport system kinase